MLRIVLGALAASLLFLTTIAEAQVSDPENTIIMELKDGRVVIALFPDKAPNHVERIKTLARQGFYDGTPFHRVIDDFMVQGGDPTGTGTGGSDLPDLKAEFNDEPHTRGTASMARSQNPNSANSQFFIVTNTHAQWLDGQYTVWGRVIEGIDVVDKIKKGAGSNGMVPDPDKLISVKVAADVQ